MLRFQVKAAIAAIGYNANFPRIPNDFKTPELRNPDMFDLLEYVFGFQVCIQSLNLVVISFSLGFLYS